ncbi:MAG: FtsX-like permease family protein [Desulfovibrionaceae bacterium]|nr:FtsX-like permease family protein [Desulfovibrionaceae bacterium]
MRRNAWSQFMALGAVTLVVFLSGLFLLVLNTLDNELSSSRGEVVIQVYWRQDVEVRTMRAQWEELSHLPGLVSWSTYTPDDALAALSNRLGQSAGVDVSFLRGKSPLPGTAVLNFHPREDNEQWLDETVKYLKSTSGVERVVANPLREELAKVWNSISRKVMLPSVCLLAGVLALVVGNTIRLTLVSRAAEIEILQLVGAENWYIRLPLLTSGSTLGLLGGLIGLGLLSLIYWQLHGLYLPPLVTKLQFLPISQIVMLVAIPVLMGFLGSYLAVRKPLIHSDPEEP